MFRRNRNRRSRVKVKFRILKMFKWIPRKIIISSCNKKARCPRCRNMLHLYYQNHCSVCGQKLKY